LPHLYKIKKVNRIIDANINRAKEGLRVCEEISRFILSNSKITAEFKKIRHNISALSGLLPCHWQLLKERETLSDAGKNIRANELKRKNIADIFFANIQRVKESVRVLEEFSKLINKEAALKFKAIRYVVYEAEKKAAKEILALCNYR
jgi:thiamine-phosphate pyrophosphorylase